MPVTDSFQRLACRSIIVAPDRQRRQIETSDLEDSIRQRGVIQPIICQRGPEGPLLVAGQRRLTASIAVGLPDIPVRWAEELSPTEAQIIELEENIKRSDLPWQDIVRATQRIHDLYLDLDPGWTLTETAQAIGLGKSVVSMYLRVGREFDHERVLAATTVREAYNVLARRDAREAGAALEELLDVPALADRVPDGLPEITVLPESGGGIVPPVTPTVKPLPDFEPVKHLSFLDWAPTYSGPKFNLIHCDFPYKDNIMSGPQIRGSEPDQIYSDSTGTYEALLECLCLQLPRLMSLSGHLMFWCSSEIMLPESPYARLTWSKFRALAPSLEFARYPLIWVKSDNAGIAADPRHGPRHVYETCLLASRGNRQIVRVVADAYQAPTDHRLHPSTKPEPMLRHFMQMLVDETTSLLDPTAGAGSSLRAADSLGARSVLGLEIDPDHVRVANSAFRSARLLRGASRGLDDL